MSDGTEATAAAWHLTARRFIDVGGEEAAMRLMHAFAGRRIPRPPKSRRKAKHIKRDALICAALTAGESYRRVGERFGLSQSRVRAIYHRSG